MESHNLSIVLFSEIIRQRMRTSKPSLIRHRRQLPLFRHYPDVFVGCEAVTWAMKSLKIVNKSTDDGSTNKRQYLSESQSCSMYQKLMDAGLLQNVTTQEEFKNDKSLFRFASDDNEAEKLIRSVAVGYRLYNSAQSSESNMFQKVCALGQLVSCECLQSCDIVAWLLNNGSCLSREAAVVICRDMVETDVLKPVDSDVQEFIDGKKTFYMFAIDYKQPPLTIEQFLSYSINCPKEIPQSVENPPTRNKLIHLRQTSDQLVNCSPVSSDSLTTDRTKGLSTSSDDSGFSDNGSNMSPSKSSYKSLLNNDGSMTRAALLHPTAPFVKKTVWVYPDPLGYGFVIRGSGPCYVKIVDPDSPAGKAGLKALQFIAFVNQNEVTELDHTAIENLILNGSKYLKLTILQHRDAEGTNLKPPTLEKRPLPSPTTPVRQRSMPALPSAQPWIKKRDSVTYGGLGMPPMRQVLSQ